MSQTIRTITFQKIKVQLKMRMGLTFNDNVQNSNYDFSNIYFAFKHRQVIIIKVFLIIKSKLYLSLTLLQSMEHKYLRLLRLSLKLR